MSERKKICDLGLTNTQKANFQTGYEHSQMTHAPSAAQENVIESIKLNGVQITPDDDKSVDITIRRASYHVTVDEMKADTSLCSVGNVKDTWVLCNE